MSEENTVEVPILVIDFETLKNICSKVDIVDSYSVITMPNLSADYADSEKHSLGNLITTLMEYESDENNQWRIEKNVVQQIQITENGINIGPILIQDVEKIIVVSKINSLYIIPGKNTIVSKAIKPNEILRLSNFISTRMFLMQFNDVKSKQKENGYDLNISFSLIDKENIVKEGSEAQ